ncbi:MAG: hypothetical protein Q8M07_12445 [Prosthecobacter sp.]|nr:hypothetical protein [Prosthecobacter sp.]
MIEGIVVTLTGTELQKLCKECAAHHHKRAKIYAEQINNMKRSNIEAANMTNGNPIANLESRMDSHNDNAAEMEFTASHLDLKEKYRLERDDLARLGICKGRGW